MEFAIIIMFIMSNGWLLYIIYRLINSLEKMTKLVKADSLQEYEFTEEEAKQDVDVWQADQRYKDVSEMDNNELSQIRVDPNMLYSWVFGSKTKTEKFN